MKIKPLKIRNTLKNILCSTVLVFLCSVISINAEPQRKTYIRYESGARGYTELVTGYTQVHARMIQDIKEGKGTAWASWISNGTSQNYSLYFWLKSELEWQSGRKNDAYITAILALMLTKAELNSCAISKKSREKLEFDLLTTHKQIVEYVPEKKVVRHAILNGGEYLDSVVGKNIKPSGQACYRAAHLLEKSPDDMTRWSVTISNSAFRRSVEDVKNRMGYYKLLKTTTINEDLNRTILRRNFRDQFVD